MIEDNEPDFESRIKAFEERWNKRIEATRGKVNKLVNEYADIPPRTEDIEKRLIVLETPRMRQLQVAKTYEPVNMPIFAEEISISEPSNDFSPFEFKLPKWFLAQATEEAIERGLVKSITIGTRPDCTCLTSI